LGEDEISQGKVKIKENGLREGHPEKEGVLVNLADLVSEVQQRIDRKANLDALVQQADGLRVVGGIKSDEAEKNKANTGVDSETEKPMEETAVSQEAIGAVPAS
jgi:histidyl-tRNA synthetase